jgi:hypothetical protein
MVNYYIQGALQTKQGDVKSAQGFLEQMRQDPSFYYDLNLALAEDFLTAASNADDFTRLYFNNRYFGIATADFGVFAYQAAKAAALGLGISAPKSGSGPPSPPSLNALGWMLSGVSNGNIQ